MLHIALQAIQGVEHNIPEVNPDKLHGFRPGRITCIWIGDRLDYRGLSDLYPDELHYDPSSNSHVPVW